MNPIAGALARSLFLAAVLVGGLVVSADADAWGKKGKKQPDYAALMSAAEAEARAGRTELALARFNDAARADPTRKDAWVRTAQVQFDAGNYGRAIVAAEEVLQRDPADLIADSVLTVSGLRIAADSLHRLRSSGALETSDGARKEAERLAATMRATLGNDILLSDEHKRAQAKAASEQRKATQRAATARRAANARRAAPAAVATGAAPEAASAPATPPAAAKKPAAANPFGVLGGN